MAVSIQEQYDAFITQKLRDRPLYLCDPEKNIKCPKTYRAYVSGLTDGCRHTLNIHCAKIDDDGNAIRILNANELDKEDM